MYRAAYSIFITLLWLGAFAQTDRIPVQLQWSTWTQGQAAAYAQDDLKRPLWCEGCFEELANGFALPVYSIILPTQGNRLRAARIGRIDSTFLYRWSDLPVGETFQLEVRHQQVRGQWEAVVSVHPYRANGNGIELLRHFSLELEWEPAPPQRELKKKKDQTYTSVLSQGTVYKVAVPHSGIFQLDKGFFDQQGIDISDLRLSQFSIYGNGGLMLPEPVAAPRAEDLQENPLQIQDVNGNDRLDEGDHIRWYATGPDGYSYDLQTGRYTFSKNDFEDQAYYFLSWNRGPSKLIQTLPSGQGGNPVLSLDSYEHLIHHEKDEVNFIHSGRYWWGDEMSGGQTTRSFSYNIPGIINGSDLRLFTSTTAHSVDIGSSIQIRLEDVVGTIGHSSVQDGIDNPYTNGARSKNLTATVTDDQISVSFEYSRPRLDAKAWIDYFDLLAERQLGAYEDLQFIFHSDALVNGLVEYAFDPLAGCSLWDITDPAVPAIQSIFTAQGKDRFMATHTDQQLKRYVLVKNSSITRPQFIQKVNPQNLHGLEEVEYVIIAPPSFSVEAERLAQFHRDHSDLRVVVVTPQQVFNEFSSGSEDVTGIRDFMKLLYDRGLNGSYPLRYLLLLGDASYDYKDRIENNTNMVTIYQSYNSLDPPASHCSDDYYGILDDSEGYWGIGPTFEAMDIGVGRIPASTVEEARIAVDKVIRYHDASFGDWVQRLSFLADDENGNNHFFCTQSLTRIVEDEDPSYNINKIYMDAHEQVSFGSGNKYPTVNTAVDQAIEQGSLVFNYVGHGGHNGMAHERVVTRPQIVNWSNSNKLAFYITASCELAAFDNPAQKSPGELMLFDEDGGAIGMVATSRVVYIGANCDVNEDIIRNNLFRLEGDASRPLGDVYRTTRNRSGGSNHINKRSFLLLGDPAMGLLKPPLKVVTTSINNIPYAQFNDTLSALSTLSIEGEIQDANGLLQSDFTGLLYPTMFDKRATYQTRGNDPASSVQPFSAQNNVMYKGQISVTDGKFSFTFVIPKDIAYHFGKGKLSYYAENGITHAGGWDTGLVVGGTTDSLKNDTTPPELKLFIDDRSWVFGGLTNSTPLLLADIYDLNGINTVGSGIGREMEAILDEGTEAEQTIVLNEYYSPELNSYQKGIINYRFESLEAGRHTLRLKVWDVYNNSQEAYTEFEVGQDGELQIEHLLNYPNPFTTHTTFHFDHNKAGQTLNARLQIYTISGRLVHTMHALIPNAPTHVAEFDWDARDQFGDRLANGVYLYRMEVTAEDGSTEKQTQKLFIIH